LLWLARMNVACLLTLTISILGTPSAKTDLPPDKALVDLVQRGLAAWSANGVELRDARLLCGNASGSAEGDLWLDVADRCRALRQKLLPLLARAIRIKTGADKAAGLTMAATILDARPRRGFAETKTSPKLTDGIAVLVVTRAPAPMRLPEASLELEVAASGMSEGGAQ
jgi:hypothetical protein